LSDTGKKIQELRKYLPVKEMEYEMTPLWIEDIIRDQFRFISAL
jgi:hypothetical protein